MASHSSRSAAFVALTLALTAGVQSLPAQEFAAAAAVNGREVLIGQPANVYAPGLVYVYRPGAGGVWTEAARIASPDSARGTGFGRKIAVDGNTLLIAESPTDSATAGRVHVYERSGNGPWRHTAALSAAGAVNGDRIGRALALKGDLAVIGATRSDSMRGQAFVFRRQGGRWQQTATLRPDDVQPGAAFGASVTIDDGFIVVGAQQADSNAGAVYVFRQDSVGGWTQEQRLTLPLPPATVGNAQFGVSLLLEDDILYVGAPGLTQFMGAVLRFRRDTVHQRWNPMGGLLPFDATPGTQFGTATGIVGNELWIGAPGSSQFEGRIFRYMRDSAGAFTSATKVAYDTAGIQLAFGSVMAVGPGIVVAGMPNADFGEGRAAILTLANGRWTQQTVSGEYFRPAAVAGREVSCEDGQASVFGCEKVNLLAVVPISDMGGKQGTRLNDVWGWTDPENGEEYAIVGRSDGTSFVDISNPNRPRYLGDLPKTEGSASAVWRDMKVYRNHVFVVADGAREHGMQVFDLTRLRRVTTPQTFTTDAHYTRINSAHNIVIDTTSGYAFIVGAGSGGESCGGGLHMVNIKDPLNPAFAGCFQDSATGRSGTGYSHDAQCVIYRGPDTRYTGREICLGANETAISISDVTDKQNPKAIGRGTYPDLGYIHQGWFSDDHRYWYQDDELDELQGKANQGTRTIIWDLAKLDDPVVAGEYFAPVKASDHNLYIVGNRMYNSNYESGLRVVDISNPTEPEEVGYFDTVPVGNDTPGFGGSWSNYPFFASGTIIVTSGKEGLFLVKDQTTSLTP